VNDDSRNSSIVSFSLKPYYTGRHSIPGRHSTPGVTNNASKLPNANRRKPAYCQHFITTQETASNKIVAKRRWVWGRPHVSHRYINMLCFSLFHHTICIRRRSRCWWCVTYTVLSPWCKIRCLNTYNDEFSESYCNGSWRCW
jgi:hypothetical protein